LSSPEADSEGLWQRQRRLATLTSESAKLEGEIIEQGEQLAEAQKSINPKQTLLGAWSRQMALSSNGWGKNIQLQEKSESAVAAACNSQLARIWGD